MFAKSRSQKRKIAQSTRFNTLMTTQPIEGDYNSIDQSLDEIVMGDQANTLKAGKAKDTQVRGDKRHGRTNTTTGINNFMVTAPVKNPSRKNVIPAKSSNQQRNVFNGLQTGVVNSNYRMQGNSLGPNSALIGQNQSKEIFSKKDQFGNTLTVNSAHLQNNKTSHRKTTRAQTSQNLTGGNVKLKSSSNSRNMAG